MTPFARLVVEGHAFSFVDERPRIEYAADLWRGLGYDAHAEDTDAPALPDDYPVILRQRLANILSMSDRWTAEQITDAIHTLAARVTEERRVNHLV